MVVVDSRSAVAVVAAAAAAVVDGGRATAMTSEDPRRTTGPHRKSAVRDDPRRTMVPHPSRRVGCRRVDDDDDGAVAPAWAPRSTIRTTRPSWECVRKFRILRAPPLHRDSPALRPRPSPPAWQRILPGRDRRTAAGTVPRYFPRGDTEAFA
jgi:hypothetical protein